MVKYVKLVADVDTITSNLNPLSAEIDNFSSAEKAGLKVGDYIKKVNGVEVSTLDELSKEIEKNLYDLGYFEKVKVIEKKSNENKIVKLIAFVKLEINSLFSSILHTFIAQYKPLAMLSTYPSTPLSCPAMKILLSVLSLEYASKHFGKLTKLFVCITP